LRKEGILSLVLYFFFLLPLLYLYGSTLGSNGAMSLKKLTIALSVSEAILKKA